MKKKSFVQGYFQIRSHAPMEHSFGVRIKYVGMNAMICGYGAFRIWMALLRPHAAKGEKFE